MPSFSPPWYLTNGVAMTAYVAKIANQTWESQTPDPEPRYESHVFTGAQDVPIYGIWSVPPQAKGTIIGTYGITGDLDNQWFLKVLGRKAIAAGYAVVLFDWRAHGKTAVLSPTLTSDGLYEGDDFVHIAAQAKALGCPAPFWFTGYSLGGQLALWGVKAAQTTDPAIIDPDDIQGGAVICPSLDSERSLRYLTSHPVGKYIEKGIADTLQKLAWKLHQDHPGQFDAAAIARADSIWGFDHELVIGRLGFASVEDYYAASSPLPLLPHLAKPTLILYAADDPLFAPTLVPDLKAACAHNPAIDLYLTQYGGHVGYISSAEGQAIAGDPDPWWAWNRILEWCNSQL
ncbi:MAG: alpha/beta fold hydrolase [Leptolyngbya sp. SIOISBB]|nr:alpha/beta fold hydrolase [Leptolyngbya sp. SIOISBB]